MIWAVTGYTAAELISDRDDSALPNMGLKSWNSSRVRQMDVTVAKNYLDDAEIEELNRIVVMYLDYAEDQANRRKQMTINEWEEKLDAFLLFNEREVLIHAGKISAQVAEQLALDHYKEFELQRRRDEQLIADAMDDSTLVHLEQTLQNFAHTKKNEK